MNNIWQGETPIMIFRRFIGSHLPFVTVWWWHVAMLCYFLYAYLICCLPYAWLVQTNTLPLWYNSFIIEYIVPNPSFYIDMVPVVIPSQRRPPISPQICVGDYIPTRLDHHWQAHKPSADLSIFCIAPVNMLHCTQSTPILSASLPLAAALPRSNASIELGFHSLDTY